MNRLFRVFIPAGVVALIFSEIVLITASFVLATFLVLEVEPTVFLLYDGGLTRLLVVTGSIMFALHFNDLYTHIRVASKVILLQQFTLVIGVAFLGQALVSYISPDMRVPIRVMLAGSTITVVTLFLWRVFYSRYALRVMGGNRILFVGWNPLVQEIAQQIEEHPELGFEPIGYLDDHGPHGYSGCKYLGAVQDLSKIAGEAKPDRIVVGISERRERMPLADLLNLRFAGFIIEEAGSTYETVCGRISTKELRHSQLIFSGELGPAAKTLFVQRIFNLAVASIGTLVSLPVMLLAAAAVKLSSPGPILYRQTRVGFHGNPFTIYKFRSMYADAEARTGAVWAKKNDPRITPIGRILRKTRVDELPQLFNVLKGDMSIVGPRPERPEFVDTLKDHIFFYPQRHAVKPGITGWAQINHKYGDTLEDSVKKLEYDLYYIKNMSQGLDTYIIFHTAKTMILSRGAQ